MDIPIILTAFGTASSSRTTYAAIEDSVSSNFPSHPIYWGYTSGILREKLKRERNIQIHSPEELVEQLGASGCDRVVVQSLHLFAGSEFHKLKEKISRLSSITCSLGSPLLDSAEDCDQLGSLLAPFITTRENQAILVVAHGTSHPVWPVYLALEKRLQSRFGSRLFLGTIEHLPKTDNLEEEIAAVGYESVLMIPLFLTTGRHFRLDMMGKEEHSWKSRLERCGLEVEALDKGLGLLPGFGRLLADHIRKALSALR